jgi:hypothetical protein
MNLTAKIMTRRTPPQVPPQLRLLFNDIPLTANVDYRLVFVPPQPMVAI